MPSSWPVPLPGEHNAANLAAAILAARAAGADDEAIARGLAGFQGSPHRAVLLRIGGRLVLDDAYNANPGSMYEAISTIGNIGAARRAEHPGAKVYAVLGDRMKAEIHALSMKTLTPAEWRAAGSPG